MNLRHMLLPRTVFHCAAILCVMFGFVVDASAFTVGNLVALRVGDGSAAISANTAPVFLEEYTPEGVLVGTVPIPSTTVGANRRLTVIGNGPESWLSLSADGNYFSLGGYDLAPGTATALNSSVIRVIARVDMTGNVDSTTTILEQFSSLRCVTSFDGSGFFAATSMGCIFVPFGSSFATKVSISSTNLHTVNLFGNQLFVSSQATGLVGVSTCGSGMSTAAAQSVSLLPGFQINSAGNPKDFYFADSMTLYVADNRTVAPSGGIQKWTLNGNVWELAYTLNGAGSSGPLAFGCGGLTGQTITGVTTLFARTGTIGGPILKVTDNGSVASSPFTTIVATAGSNRIFRGLRYVTGPTAVSGCTVPAIEVQPPAAVSQCANTFTTIGISATGTGLGYQWHQSTNEGSTWTPAATIFSSGFSPTMLTASTAATNTKYRCIVTSPCGSLTSSTSTLSITGGVPPSTPFTQSSVLIGAGQQPALFASATAGQAIEWFSGSSLCGVDYLASGSPFFVTSAPNVMYRARARNLATGCNSTSCATTTVLVHPYAPVVISQFYGGNGINPGAIYNRSFIELYNRATSQLDLSNYTLQFTSDGVMSTWHSLALPGTIPANGYYLISVGAPGSYGGDLPSPDASAAGNFLLNPGEGRIALVRQSTPLSGGCFSSTTSNVADLVGWHPLTVCFEGTGAAPINSSNQHSTVRRANGSQDTNDNAVDFLAMSPPMPRNTSSGTAPATANGACCLGDGQCLIMTQPSCEGIYLGDETVCGEPSYHVTTKAAALDDISTQSPNTILIISGNATETVQLPFSFSFLGVPRTQVSICRHGWMAFTPTTSTTAEPQALPSPSAPNDVLAPYWRPMTFLNNGQVCSLTKGVAPNRRFIVQWDKMYTAIPYNIAATFQVILWETTNAVEFRYGTVDHNAIEYVGAENRWGTAGIQVSGFDIGSGGASVGKLLVPTGGCSVSGACCILSGCTMTSAYACQQAGGVFHGYTATCTPSTCCAASVADINNDNVVDTGDISPFVDVLLGNDSDALHLTRSDANCDGRANGLDVDPFVVRLLP